MSWSMAVKTSVQNDKRVFHSNGSVELLDGATVVSMHTLSASAGSVVDDVWILEFVTDTVAATGSGTVDGAALKDSGGNVTRTLTVGLVGSGAQVELQNLSINAPQNVEITSATIQHAA